ncbi:MAG: hypothetical protein CMP23_13395 [Rickettsiales bacterium]|nr:hypothetical protein [Rickettsiales bacterium]|tara:strand:+ start:454 stop:1971 length:1518 start_codon:yes stop_codon:yes gene_type:complete
MPARLGRLSALLCGLLLLIAPVAVAQDGGVLSTGFAPDPGGLAHLQGSGSGFFLVGAARSEYRLSQFRSARDEVVTRQPLWQSFRFSIRDDHPRRRIGFEMSLRGGGDLSRPGFHGEVLYAFVDIAPAARWARLRLGRQLLAVAGGQGLLRLDGAVMNVNLHHLGVEAYAGVPLRSRFVVRPEGAEEHPTGWGKDWAWGLSLRAINLRYTQGSVGVRERFRDGELSRRQLSLDLHQGIGGRLNLRGELVADLLQRRISEATVAIDGRPLDWLSMGFDYERWQVSFGAEELFSVFTTDPYDALRGYARLQPEQWLTLLIAGGVQVYPLAVTRDFVPRPESGRTSATQQFVVTLRPVPAFSIEIGERLLAGTGGEKLGLHLQLRAATPGRRLSARFRGDLQRYAFELQPQLAGTYGSAVIELEIRPQPWMRVGVSGRALFSPWLNDQLQASVTFDFLLGIRRLPRSSRALSRLEDWQPSLAVQALNRSVAEPLVPGLLAGFGGRGQR